MLSFIESVPEADEVPEAVDVVVIGGGIIGTAATYELARQGVRVALLEKGRIGGEQSSRNWGWCRQQNRDPKELPLAMYSLQRWEELQHEIGKDLGFRRTGIVYATTKQDEVGTWEAWGEKARECGFYSEILTPARAQELTPGSSSKWVGGVWSKTDGHADPFVAAPRLAMAARENGAIVLQNCAARGLDVQNNKVTGVWTEKGRISAQKVVCAGGAWASLFGRRHGIKMPQAHVNGTAMLTSADVPGAFSYPLYVPGFCLCPTSDGAYTLALTGRGRVELTPQLLRSAAQFWPGFKSRIPNLKFRVGKSFFRGPEANHRWQFDGVSPFEKLRILDPKPDRGIIREAMRSLQKEYPETRGLKIRAAWAGLIDSTPDLVPVISPAGPDGFLLAAGFSGHGFGIGPAAGRLIADLVRNAEPIVDPWPYRLERFTDGSEISKPGLM